MEEDKLPQTRLFWVLLTIFGSLFATGLFIIFQSLWWGILDTLFGFLGLIVLIRDRITVPQVAVRTPLLVIAVTAVSVFVGHSVAQVFEIRSDLDTYAMPRSLTQKQADILRKYLLSNEAYAFPLVVRAGANDAEAIEYGSDFVNAFAGSGWTISLDTPETMQPVGGGLEIENLGNNAEPPDPQHRPEEILRKAFEAAHIPASSGGSGAGEYKLFLLIGHRPVKLEGEDTTLFKLGQWFEKIGQ